MVRHTLRSAEAKSEFFPTFSNMSVEDIKKALTNETASLCMSWYNVNDIVFYCWWKAESPEAIVAIIKTLGPLGQTFENEIRETPNVINVAG